MLLKYFLHELLTTVVLAAILWVITLDASAQGVYEQTIEVSTSKTTSIVFPADIKTVDRGSRDILSQKTKGAENVLKVKAGKVNFPETNLTVITVDGALNHFTVRFKEKPKRQIFYASLDESRRIDARPPLIHLSEVNHAEVDGAAKAIVLKSAPGKIKTLRKHDMRLTLKGIYIEGNLMYFHVRIANQSNIPYDVDMLRLYTRDKQRVKRTAAQEVAELPLYVYGDATRIEGTDEVDVVYVLPKLTIPDAKVLTLQVMEKRGGRHLTLNIKNKSIVRAQVVQRS